MTDVRMPDGTIITNVPDGITQSELLERLNRTDLQPFAAPESASTTPALAESEFPSILNDPRVAPKVEPIVRQLGLTVRAGIDAGAGMLDIVNAPMVVGFNKILELTGSDFRFKNASQLANELKRGMGLPEPANATERLVQDIGRTVIGAGTGIGIAGQVAKLPGTAGNVGNILASNTPQQAAAATTGGLGAGLTREAGGGPGAQMGVGLASAFIPGLAAQAPNVVRNVTRGQASADDVAARIDDFAAAGTVPTVSQATGGRIPQAVESLLAKVPGGAGQIAEKGAQIADDISARITALANKLAPSAEPTRAGLSIERGITGKGGFVEIQNAKASKLYKKVDKNYPDASPVQPKQTIKLLNEEAQPVTGAKNISQVLANPRLLKIRTALIDDLVASGKNYLPYEVVKQVRSQVGRLITNSSLVDDIPLGQLKRLYAALSADIMSGAKATGSAAAVKDLTRADNFYNVYLNRIENLRKVVQQNGGPEKVYKAAMAGSADGATTIRRVMQSLPPRGRRDFAAAVLKRMGRATASKQDASGEAFSIETFLTNWSKLDGRARGALFSRFGPAFTKDIESIARTADRLRQGSNVFANPSGSGQIVLAGQTVLGGAFAIALGQFTVGIAAFGTMAGANLGARLMTNPQYVRWLAQTSKMEPQNYTAHISMLANLANDEQNEDLALAAAMHSEENSKRNQGQEPNGQTQ